MHFQKRKMKNKVSISTDSFFIVPNQFINIQSGMNNDIFDKYTKNYLINSTMIGFILRILLIQLKIQIKKYIHNIW